MYLAGRCEVLRFSDSTALAQAAAEAWVERVAAAPALSVALSGGRIAVPFFKAVVAAAGESRVRFERIHFFWADERCVPPNDPESNYLSARVHLLEPLGISSANVHRIRGELSAEAAARAAEADLAASVPGATLDLVFLGMGEDGHVASLFPGEPELERRSPRLYRPVRAPKPPPERVTLGYGMLAGAREAVVLAAGEGKRRALAESLSPDGTTPLGLVLRERAKTLVLTDGS
jgi:6-phosphogluconolactonase